MNKSRSMVVGVVAGVLFMVSMVFLATAEASGHGWSNRLM